ncbi:MAG TPA: GNAT family N-acetyltransferase [Chthonomonadales bacterium]|nr:GNAT family N-acetyltransferase [Chthonomonadales bacterium]
MPLTMDQAVEVFARGFSFTRSYTHPYPAQRVDGLWQLRDEPRDAPRREEFISHGLTPEAVHQTAQARSDGRYCISLIRSSDESAGPIIAAFKALGYRYGSSELMMANVLTEIPDAVEPFPVTQVTTLVQAERLAKAARARQILPHHLTDTASGVRQYMAADGDRPVGWLRSVVVADHTWCTNVFVVPAYRRKGIARAMLVRMLRDDLAAGSNASVLTASRAGSQLYPTVGYRTIGELLFFTPPRVPASLRPALGATSERS